MTVIFGLMDLMCLSNDIISEPQMTGCPNFTNTEKDIDKCEQVISANCIIIIADNAENTEKHCAYNTKR